MHRKPVLERAVKFLREQVVRSQLHNEQKLPSVERLANECGVSRITMWKAVRELVGESILSTQRGGKITRIVNGSNSAQPSLQNKNSKLPVAYCDTIESCFKGDVYKGRFETRSALPTIKQLSVEYGVCYRTLKKVIINLEKSGIVYRSNKRYFLVEKKSSSRNKIILFASGNSLGRMYFFSPRTEFYLFELRNECIHRKLYLEIITVDFDGKIFVKGKKCDAASYLNKQEIHGVFIWTMGLPVDAIRECLCSIISTGKKLSILDESGDFDYTPYMTARKDLVNVIHTSDYMAGVKVGNFITTLNHRRIAYISFNHSEHYSIRRLQGLKSIEYPISGNGPEIVEFVTGADQDSNYPEIYAELENTIVDNLSHNTSWSSIALLNTILEKVRWAQNIESFPKSTQTILQLALDDKSITAWVAANDKIAFKCMNFLNVNKKRVGRDIALVSFDDSLDSMYYQITSYNFNSRAIVSTMIESLYNNPSSLQSERMKNFYPIPGSIISRASTDSYL